MTREELTKSITAELSAAGIPDCGFEALQIVKEAFNKHGAEQAEKAASEMLERRKRREPLQYIFGKWEFYGLPFYVGSGVLIPRADTEIAVDTAVSLLNGRCEPTVFDLCAGTGSIGTAVAKHTDAKVTFFEKEAAAFSYLVKNVKLNAVEAKTFMCDVLLPENVPDSMADMIICNPPYIKTGVLPTLDCEVKCEPVTALDGGEDGLTFYRTITDIWKKALKPGGFIVYEIGFDERVAVSEILTKEGFGGVTAVKDYGGNDRVVYGTKI